MPKFIKLKEPEKNSNQKTHSIKTIDISTFSNEFLTTISILSDALCFQVAISVNPYSGQGQPPMYGDYEAQRHWMEITYNLPIDQWYLNGTNNDLMYWGLDYPPLTAYHHYILGCLAQKFNKNWISLGDSRGFESTAHKLFMRFSAIIPFYILYLPMLIFYFNQKNKKSTQISKSLALLYPALLVIDNGHFQYNSISLGLFLGTYIFLTKGFTLIGSIFFVGALNYKQMELYHALPVFVFILSRSINKNQILTSFFKIFRVGLLVISSFIVIWLPFILTGTAKDVLIRVFPFNRGLYEDKVASFWCAFSFVLKRLPIQNVQIYLSTALVVLFSIPSLLSLFLHPSDKNFRLSLTATSLSFFLFSFHVHEKTILLAAIPALLVLPDHPDLVLWFLNISNISIFSLCLKDNFSTSIVLFFAYFVVSITNCPASTRTRSIQVVSMLIGFSICILEMYGPRNQRFPHIYQLANAFFSCVHFLFFLFSFTLKTFQKTKVE